MSDLEPKKEDVEFKFRRSFDNTQPPNKMWRFISRGLIIIGLFVLVAGYIMYQRDAVDVVVALKIGGWGGFYLFLGTMLLIISKVRSLKKGVAPCKKASW